MISFGHKGNLSKTFQFLKKANKGIDFSFLNQYGKEGVKVLSEATPKKTGKTADSWSYKISHEHDRVTISFLNSNIQNGIPIAIILQYGHATKNGGWVQGRDYINPAIQPIFDRIVIKAWKEVTKL